jgi:hypothetical protein
MSPTAGDFPERASDPAVVGIGSLEEPGDRGGLLLGEGGARADGSQREGLSRAQTATGGWHPSILRGLA